MNAPLDAVLHIQVPSPFFEPVPGIGQGQEPAGVQAFCSQTAVEGLNVGVIRGCAGAGEVDLHPVQVCPLVQQTTGKFRAVAHREV